MFLCIKNNCIAIFCIIASVYNQCYNNNNISIRRKFAMDGIPINPISELPKHDSPVSYSKSQSIRYYHRTITYYIIRNNIISISINHYPLYYGKSKKTYYSPGAHYF